MTNSIITNILAFFIGYVIGSLAFAIIISKVFLKKDIRKIGSKNAGATNIVRTHNLATGILVFFLDGFKVFFSIVLIYLFQSNIDYWKDCWTLIAGFGAFLGHLFPIFFKFKGGKGVAAIWGLAMGINVIFGIGCLLVFYFFVKLFKKVSAASLATVLFNLIILWIISYYDNTFNFFIANQPSWLTGLIMTLCVFLIFLKHWENIKRLIQKRESTIDQILKK